MLLVIDRNRWDRGRAGQLLTEDGKMCVLGFLGRVCGVPDDILKTNEAPNDPRWPGYVNVTMPVSYSAHQFWRYVVSVNDAQDVTDAWREHWLGVAFAWAGVSLSFVDGKALDLGDDRGST